MQKIEGVSLTVWIGSVTFFVLIATFLAEYLSYLNVIVPFSYDWEPTDGDHLNFIHRLASGLPIYLSLDNGEVLSIYNPLYHAIVALFGGEYASLSLARFFSLIFWALIPLSVFVYFKKKWGVLYAILAAFFIWLPPTRGMLIALVQVGPDTALAFFFLITILYAHNITHKQHPRQWEWMLLGVLSSFTYFVKQQGLIAIAVVIIFLLLQRKDKRRIVLTLLGFTSIFIPVVTYLELVNSGGFLNATVFDLRSIMPSDIYLVISKLWHFFNSNFYFIIGVLLSFVPFVFITRNIKNLSIWQVSFILHIPFLLVILGNNGGGPNYFSSFWISIVILCIDLIRKEKNQQILLLSSSKLAFILTILIVLFAIRYADYAHVFMFINVTLLALLILLRKFDNTSFNAFLKKHAAIFSLVILFGLFVDIYKGMSQTNLIIKKMNLPTKELEKTMEDYYDSVALLSVNKLKPLVLTNRNIGAFSTNNFIIDNEGATMFSYAWPAKNIFKFEVVLENIRNQKYDFISTGLTKYPKEVMSEIITYYTPVFTKPINLHFGRIGLVTVYRPKNSTLLNNNSE
jgi:hypothetical protein